MAGKRALSQQQQQQSQSQSQPHQRMTASIAVNGVQQRWWFVFDLFRVNQLLVSCASNAKANVVVFPGDIQDFASSMVVFEEYAYEAIPDFMTERFGSDVNVWIIKPARTASGSFSCFEHFTVCNHYGAVAEYTPRGFAARQLTALMENAVKEMKQQHDYCIDVDLPLHLIGFSKGVVVVNQLVTELADTCEEHITAMSTSSSPPTSWSCSCSVVTPASPSSVVDHSIAFRLFSRVASIHWLDGGNGSKEGSVPLNERALNVLATFRRSIKLFVHVTPYQMMSKDRPWIAQEVDQFVEQMESRDMEIVLKRYHYEEPPDITMHMQLLQEFTMA